MLSTNKQTDRPTNATTNINSFCQESNRGTVKEKWKWRIIKVPLSSTEIGKCSDNIIRVYYLSLVRLPDVEQVCHFDMLSTLYNAQYIDSQS